MEKRKNDHILLAFQSQMDIKEKDSRFYYEPLLSPHPTDDSKSFIFLGKEHKIPMWVSSITGGTQLARKINTNLARVCNEFGMGMGLGSCRIILNDETHFADFDMREVIGNDLPFYANLGISQIEEFLASNKLDKINDLVHRLKADGLIIHVNPMQEWFQPEGDRLHKSPIETIERFIEKVNYSVIVKEVGQGMGPESLKALMKLPLTAIEFAAFGGTNFSKIELMRNDYFSRQLFEPFASIGEDAESMTNYINRIVEEEGDTILCNQIIISGGIKHFLDGYYLVNKLKLPAIYGQASSFLRYAKESYDDLFHFVDLQAKGLKLAEAFLKVRE